MSIPADLSQESDCGVGSTGCNFVVMNAMSFKTCDSSGVNVEEFASFEDHMSNVAQSNQLNVGVRVKSCVCDKFDNACTNTVPDGADYAGVQLVVAAGTCTNVPVL